MRSSQYWDRASATSAIAELAQKALKRILSSTCLTARAATGIGCSAKKDSTCKINPPRPRFTNGHSRRRLLEAQGGSIPTHLRGHLLSVEILKAFDHAREQETATPIPGRCQSQKIHNTHTHTHIHIHKAHTHTHMHTQKTHTYMYTYTCKIKVHTHTKKEVSRVRSSRFRVKKR